VLLLAVGLGACGGGDSSSSIATEAATQAQAEAKSNGGASSNGESQSTNEGRSQGSGDGGSGNFVPKHHNDSGGGSEQFRVSGGDNSVQEYGAEADASERDRAATVLHDFLDARVARDWAAACSYLASSVAEGLEELAAKAKHVEDPSCAGIFEKLTNPAAMGDLRTEAAQADVGSLRFEGDRAFLIYRGIRGIVLAMPMTNEGGSWKVGSLAGTPLN
jgi:hypothetical protein